MPFPPSGDERWRRCCKPWTQRTRKPAAWLSSVVSPDDCAPEKCWENCVNTSAPRPAFPREICERATQDGHHPVFALQEMAELNGLPENAIDKLEKCLDDPDEGVQKGAARAMSWVRPSN